MVTLSCRRCGRTYEALNRGKLYCSTYCRRKYQDERRKEERAEAREIRELDVLVTEWRADYGVVEFLDQCSGCRFARRDKKTRQIVRPFALVCDACRMA